MLLIVSVYIIQVTLYIHTIERIFPSLCSTREKCFLKARCVITTISFLSRRKSGLFAVIVLLLGEHLSS